MEKSEKINKLIEAGKKFDNSKKLIEEAFGKETPFYSVALAEANLILHRDFADILNEK